MRLSVSILALMAASPLVAEDVMVRADIAEAVVYAEMAEVVRRVDLDLPEGDHRILFPADLRFDFRFPPLVAAQGAELSGAVAPMRDWPIPEGSLDSPAQAEARARLDAAYAAFDAAEAELNAARGAIRAAELQQSYLRAVVSGGEGGAHMPADAGTLSALLATLGAEMAEVDDRLRTAGAEEAELEAALDQRALEVEIAVRALEGLKPIAEESDLWSISVSVEEPGPVTLDITEFLPASWAPVYELHLNSETGVLEVDRQVELHTEGALPWQDVAVTFSTSDPFRQRAPGRVQPSLAQLQEFAALSRSTGIMTADAPMMLAEPVVIVEESANFTPIEQGLSLSFPYPQPVSTSDEGRAFLPFGSVELQAELINRAVPRRDTTAFLVADVENTSGAPILPGAALFFRDGALIGEGYLEFLPDGADVELPFGPLDHIELTWTDLSRDTGERGVFASSDTEERRVMVAAQNLSGEAVTLELLYATPFSEQEALEVEVTSSLTPDDTAWEDLRGVYAWDLALDPGQEKQIRMDFDFRWPEGQMLDWRP